MGYLKTWVFRRRLMVSKVGESLILRGSPFQTVAAKQLNDLLQNLVENHARRGNNVIFTSINIVINCVFIHR